MEVSDLGPGAEHAAEAGERVVLTRKGAPVAAVVSLEDLRQLEAIEAEEDRVDVEAVQQFDADVAAGRAQLVPLEQVKRDLPANPYARTLAASGTGQSRFTDVSSDKYRHLAEIYADNHDE